MSNARKVLVAFFVVLVAFSVPHTVKADIASGTYFLVLSAGNFGLDIVDFQLTKDGTPTTPLNATFIEVPAGNVVNIGPFEVGSVSNSLEVTYSFDGATYTYIVPPDWEQTGLQLNKNYTMITAIGEPLNYPLFQTADSDTVIEMERTITIGVIGPQGLAEWSPGGMQQGAELAALEINAAGGVDVGGTPYYIALDEGNEWAYDPATQTYDVAKAIASVTALLYQYPQFIIGGFRTEVTYPIIEAVMDYNMGNPWL